MRHWFALALAFLGIFARAQAQPISKTVPANKTTTVFVYTPFLGATCRSQLTVATLIDKPRHGRVSHFTTPASIPDINRFTNRPTGCMSKPITGFAVTYAPDRGFHGPDSFSLYVEFKESGRTTTDTFSINVE